MSKFKSIFVYTCPKCRLTKMYKEPFNMSKPVEMNHSCEVCGQKFEPEPGFYYGAMFISYILSGWIFILLALLFVFGFKLSLEWSMGIVVMFAILTFFKLMRISRSLWIHFIVKYDPNFAKQEIRSNGN